MTYYGDYGAELSAADGSGWLASAELSAPAWACSLFAALGDPDSMVYGRNFDWQFSPALLLFTDPPDGYASVSMVDIAYLGFTGAKATTADEVALDERLELLSAYRLPFDGMNEQGVAVGMAAVPPGGMEPDPAKQTVDSLMVIRKILDQAGDVDEAVEILQRYNIAWGSGPPLHYLVADRSGRAMLVEFYRGEIVVTPNESGWHQATNFLRASAGESAEGACWRYDRISQRLADVEGQLGVREAMDLLSEVSQQNTQWSVVYGISSGEIEVVMGRAHDEPHDFHLVLGDPKIGR
jgi:hypothetical protein